ncbi:sterol 3-beta-glucosyltransferase [Stemphylium lycopersici]|uniref:Sterol 3-beta-glucosyltransferase n=1 Tax=Stemphylium lycopersici TaxID=183478 RepID=A0A364N4J9_STELY|nr:sterol 3-beta-glucosyltransferase [Stemphylium lycopersici]
MTAVNTTTESKCVEDANVAYTETSSLMHVEPTPENEQTPLRQTSRENADLYDTDLPEYSPLVTNGELSVEAEEMRDEKDGAENRLPRQSLSPAYEEYQTRPLPSPTHDDHPSQRWWQNYLDSQDGGQNGGLEHDHTPGHHTPTEENTPLVVSPTASYSDHSHLTEPLTNANLAGLRTCSILHDRAATWIIRKRDLPLSTLAAAVLTKEGLLQPKELKLIADDGNRDPTDPVSGALLGCFDTIGGIVLGLAAGPIELGKQASPMFKASKPGANDDDKSPTEEKPGSACSRNSRGIPRAAGQVALGAAKGLGRIVTTSAKSPALIMHGVTRGFHNLPKAYGEEVRVYENVTGLRSGLLVSAKSFGHGLGDGLRDLATKPIEGAEKNGVNGFTTGLATGLANLAFKPAAERM